MKNLILTNLVVILACSQVCEDLWAKELNKEDASKSRILNAERSIIPDKMVGDSITELESGQFEKTPLKDVGSVLRYGPGVRMNYGSGPRDIEINIR